MDPQSADILLTLVDRGQGELSQLIQYFTRDDDLWTPSHAAMFVSPETVIEAVAPLVKETPFAFYRDSGAQWMILRIPTLTEGEREVAVVYARRKYLGVPYDGAKLLLEALDATFKTTWWAKTFGIEAFPICSVLVAACLKHAAGWRFRDPKTEDILPTNGVTPNAILSNAQQYPQELTVIAGNVLSPQGGAA